MRLAVTGAAVEREILRQNVKQHAVAFQANIGGELDGVSHVLGVHFARAAEFIDATALRAADSHSADADRDAFDRGVRSPLGIDHGGADGIGQRFLIGDAAFGPAILPDCAKAVGEIADVIAIERADDAAGAGTAGIQADGELKLCCHYWSTLLIYHRNSVFEAHIERGRVRQALLDFGIIANEILIAQAEVMIAEQ